mgnify:CR=1 FL=1
MTLRAALRILSCSVFRWAGRYKRQSPAPNGQPSTGSAAGAIADGFQTFISGMARGVDLWAAEIVLELRDEGAAIRLICASPYTGFETNKFSGLTAFCGEILAREQNHRHSVLPCVFYRVPCSAGLAVIMLSHEGGR